MQDFHDFRQHMDTRFDRLESKMDTVVEKTVTHETQIQHLQGFSRLVISILIAVSGFFALGYFSFLKGP